jgi:RNA polymerase sigma-70 factor (ECF subfamily)
MFGYLISEESFCMNTPSEFAISHEVAISHVEPPGRSTGSHYSLESGVPDELAISVTDACGWQDTADRIRKGDPNAMAELYGIFSSGIRYLLLRSLGVEDLDDRVHDCFLIVIAAIRSGDIREPERLMGYVRTVVRRQIATHIQDAVTQRARSADLDDSVVPISGPQIDPEQAMTIRQHVQIARRAFNSLSQREQEILRRFYLHEQQPAQICVDMGLTSNQFRLMKSRAKNRFGKLGQNLVQSRSLGLSEAVGMKASKKDVTDRSV